MTARDRLVAALVRERFGDPQTLAETETPVESEAVKQHRRDVLTGGTGTKKR